MGKGTSFAITTSKFAEKRNTFEIPGRRKYMPISTLPMEKRLIDISIDYSYSDPELGQTKGTCC